MANELKPFSVKPIDWRDMTYEGVEEWIGHCALSQSFTIRDESKLCEEPEYRFTVRPFLSSRTSFPTAAEAKAAAQADYERRILSAIEPAPAASSYSDGIEAAAIPGQYGAYTPVTLSGRTALMNDADLAAGVRDVNERMSRTMHKAQEVFAHGDEPQDEPTQKPRAYMRRWAYDGVDVTKIHERYRPHDSGFTRPVTLTQLFPDDVPLYSLEPKP